MAMIVMGQLISSENVNATSYSTSVMDSLPRVNEAQRDKWAYTWPGAMNKRACAASSSLRYIGNRSPHDVQAFSRFVARRAGVTKDQPTAINRAVF
jgi:hypothetical protein